MSERTRMDWLICRHNPAAPAGVTYYAGSVYATGTATGTIIVPAVSLFRSEASIFDEDMAKAIAAGFNLHCPSLDDNAPWRALPAVITPPQRGLTATDVANLRAAFCEPPASGGL